MHKKTARVPLLAVASVLFLGITGSSSPLMPSASDIDRLSATLPRLFGAGGEERASTDRRGNQLFRLMEEDRFHSLVAEEPRAFELFGRHDKEAVVAQLPHGMPFRAAIESTAARYQLDSRLLAAVVEAESNFNPRAVSPKGAVGLTQVLPATGGLPGEELHNPERNLDAGARYLRTMLDQFDQDVELALAAYNAGPGRVIRHGGVPPYSQTRAYVRKVLALYQQHQQGGWKNGIAAISGS